MEMSFDLKFLENIADFGDINLKDEEINLSPLLSTDIERSKFYVIQIIKLSLSERKKIGNYLMWLQLGRVFEISGEMIYANIAYRIAILQEPNVALTWKELGIFLLKQGKNDEAVKCLRKADALNPNDIDICFFLGQFLVEMRDKVKYYRKIIEIEQYEMDHGESFLDCEYDIPAASIKKEAYKAFLRLLIGAQDNDFLIISKEPDNIYVQFLRNDNGTAIECEAVSNLYIEGGFQLNAIQNQQLLNLGFELFNEGNYSKMISPISVQILKKLADEINFIFFSIYKIEPTSEFHIKISIISSQ